MCSDTFLFTYAEPRLKALINELHPVRDSWFKIGLELDIPHTELICFRKRHSDFSDAMCEMLIHWLRTTVDPCPSWEAVVTALRSPLVNEKNIAAQLESKYCLSMQHMMDESTSQPTKTKKREGTISKITPLFYVLHYPRLLSFRGDFLERIDCLLEILVT